MSATRHMTRRTLLRGMLGGAAVAVGLPALECMLNSSGTALADGTGLPTRLGMFFWGNGMLPDRWVPAETGADYALSEQLAPLEPVRDVITVVTGMNLLTKNVVPHWSGIAGLLTGRDLILNEDDGEFAGPTFDQIAADAIGGATRFRSLEIGAEPEGGWSFAAKGAPNPAESSPHALFERIFGAGFAAPGEEVEPDPRVGLRRSVLDAVLDQASRLSGELGYSDRQRLAQHMEGIRELELQLARLQEAPPQLDACAAPEPPEAEYPDIEGRPQLVAKGRAFADLIAMALACDQTRVFTNWFTAPVNNLLFEGTNAGHHQLTHDEPGGQPMVHAITLQVMTELAWFIDRLRQVDEGDGTLLDHMALLCTSDVSLGRNHSVDEMPVIVAGSAHGKLETGIHYRAPGGDNVHKVILGLMRVAGVPAASFGEGPAYTKDSLGGIET